MGRLSALLAVAGMLIGTIAWEVTGAPRGDAPIPDSRTPAMKPASPPLPRNDMSEWVAHILARPLFSPDRRPAADAGDVAMNGITGLPRLSGIMIGPFGRSAIFDGNGRKAIVLSEGGHIDSYTIKSIGMTQVQVLGPNGLQRLQPTFGATTEEVAVSPGPTRHIGRTPQ